MAVGRGYRTTFGLNRWVILAYSTTALAICSYAVGGVDPFRRLLIMNRTAVNDTDSRIEQLGRIEHIVAYGFASTVGLSLLVALWFDFSRPRVNALSTSLVFAVALVATFNAESAQVVAAGAIVMGATFCAAFNSRLTVASLFPLRSELVIDCFGIAPDMSQLAFLILAYIAEKMESEERVKRVVEIYAVVIFISACLDFILLPAEPYYDHMGPKFRKRMEEAERKMALQKFAVKKFQTIRKIVMALRREENEDCALADLTLIEQVCHPLATAVCIFTSFALFRKFHILSTFRFTVEEYARQGYGSMEYANVLAEAMNIANALSCLPSTFLTNLFANSGILPCSWLIGVLGCVCTLTLAIPSLHAQWITVLCFALWGSHVFVYCFAAVAEYFGAAHMDKLQGSMFFLAGIVIASHPVLMEALEWPFTHDDSNDVAPPSAPFPPPPEGAVGSRGLLQSGGDNFTKIPFINLTLPTFQVVHIGLTFVGLAVLGVTLYEQSIMLPHIQKLRAARDATRKALESQAQAHPPQQQSQRQSRQGSHDRGVMEANAEGLATFAQGAAMPPLPRSESLTARELEDMLMLLRADQLPPSITQQSLAEGIAARVSALGLDPAQFFASVAAEDTGKEEEDPKAAEAGRDEEGADGASSTADGTASDDSLDEALAEAVASLRLPVSAAPLVLGNRRRSLALTTIAEALGSAASVAGGSGGDAAGARGSGSGRSTETRSSLNSVSGSGAGPVAQRLVTFSSRRESAAALARLGLGAAVISEANIASLSAGLYSAEIAGAAMRGDRGSFLSLHSHSHSDPDSDPHGGSDPDPRGGSDGDDTEEEVSLLTPHMPLAAADEK